MIKKIKIGIFKILPISMIVTLVGSLFLFTTTTLPVKAAAPTMTAVTADTNDDGTVDQITITFSEASDIIDGNSSDGLDSIAISDGCNIVGADYAADNVTTLDLSLSGCAHHDTSITPTVTYTAVADCSTHNAICDDALANQMADNTNTTSVDNAEPVLTDVVLSSTANLNRIAFSYTENVTVTDGASSNTIGDITTAGTVTGIGSFATTGDVTVATTKNTVGGSGTSTITIDLANQADAYMAANSTTEPDGVFTPVSTAAVVDANNNQVNPNAAPTSINTSSWDLTKPTVSSITVYDSAGGNNGKIDQAVIIFSENIRDASIADADAHLGTAGTTTGTFSTGVSDDNTTTFTRTVDDNVVDTSIAAGDFTYNTGYITDRAGNLLNATTDGQIASGDVTETDGAKPILTSFKYQSSGNNGSVDKIEVHVSESIGWNGNDKNQFTINNDDLSGFDSDTHPDAFNTGSPGIFYLTTSGTTNLTGVNGGTEPTIRYTQSTTAGNRINDGNGNDLVSMGDTLISDGAAPVLISHDYEDLNGDGTVDNIYLQFSENLDDDVAAMTSNDFDVTINGASTGQGGVGMVETLNTGTADDDEIDINFTNGFTDDTNDDYEININSNKVGDANANYSPSLTNFDCSDGAAPVFTSVSPATGSYQHNANVSYTLSETLNTGQITWTHTGGTADGGSPHNQSLIGTELNTGVHTDITLTNDPTLVDGAVYTISFDGSDSNGNSATQVNSTGVTLDKTPPTLSSINIISDNTNATQATTGNSVTLSFTASETITTPTVVFKSGGAAITNSASITNPSGNNWKASYTVDASDTDGAVTFTIDYVDSSGNSGVQETSVDDGSSVTVDKTPSTVIITSPADSTRLKGSATYTFTSSEPVNQECRINTGAWEACTSGNAFSTLNDFAGLGEVGFSLTVRDTDASGNIGTATRNFVKDTTAPVPTVTVDTASIYNGDLTQQVTITYNESMDNTTIPTVVFANSINFGSATGGAWSTTNVTDDTYIVNFTHNGTGEETLPANITVGPTSGATDLAGNADSAGNVSFDIDTVDPFANITSAPSPTDGSQTINFTVSDGSGSGVASVKCSVDNTTFTACLPGDAYSTLGGWGGISDGNLTLTLKVTDNAGNVKYDTANFVKDTAPPTISENTPVSTPTNNTNPTVNITSDDSATIVVSGGCGSQTTSLINGNTNVILDSDNAGAALSEGNYGGCTIVATDSLGNSSTPLTLSAFTIDTSAPSGYSVSIDQGTYINSTNDTAVSFTFAGAEVGANYNYSFDDTNGATVAVSGNGTIATATDQITGIDISSLDDDTITLTVTLTDVAGNTGGASNDTVTKDTVAPNFANIADPVIAVQQNGSASTTPSNIWYYYSGNNLRFTVAGQEAGLTLRACVQSISSLDGSSTCDASEFTNGTVNTDYVQTTTNLGGNVYEFNASIASLSDSPIANPTGTANGYPMNVALIDAAGNIAIGAIGNQIFNAVFEAEPRDIDSSIDNASTTSWSTINDFTAATNLVFNKNGDVGTLTFTGPINLTDQNTISALQALSTNVITGGNDGSGSSILGIRSDNLSAFDTDCMISAVVPVANHPGLIVYDNTGAVAGYVANNQSNSIIVGGDTLDNFAWDPVTKTISWTTTGFSSFGTDNTGPTVTDANISVSGASGRAGAYKIGDTITVSWNNSATGDNNTDFSSATADLSAFGGPATVNMTDTSACGGTTGDDIYEACYTILGTESIDDINLNATVTAYDSVNNPTTTADTSNITVDTIAPQFSTNGGVMITTDVNSDGIANIGDSVNYIVAGLAGVTDVATSDNYIDFTNLTGDAIADHDSGPFTVISGSLSGAQTFTTTAIDDAGNTTHGTSDSVNVDNRSRLTSTSASANNTQTSASATYTFAFTTNNIWPNDGVLKVTFPTGFNVANLAGKTPSNLTGVDGTFVVTVSGQDVIITRQADGAAVTASTAVSMSLGTGTNKSSAGNSGTFTYTTYQNDGSTVIDIDDAVSGFTLTAPAPAPTPTPSSGGGGGGGGGGGSAPSSPPSDSNTATSSASSTIDGIITRSFTYSRSLQLSEDMIVENDDGSKTAKVTADAEVTIKPNKKSTVSVHIAPNTEVTGDSKWDGKISPPIIKSTTMISLNGERINGVDAKLKRTEVDAIVKVGSINSPIQLSNPALLEIPTELPEGTRVRILFTQKGNTWEDFGVAVVKNGVLRVVTDHFSYFAISEALADELGDAPESLEFNGNVEYNEVKTNVDRSSDGFKDIANHWAKDYINEIVSLGIAKGRTADTFDPDAAITRAELTKMVVVAFNIPLEVKVNTRPFSDVATSQWYANYIDAARNKGIVSGYKDKTFKPNANVNRAEAIKILLEAAGFDDIDSNFENNYSSKTNDNHVLLKDVDINYWFAKYVAYCMDFNIVSGYPDGEFKGANYITRAEVSKVLIKILNNK